VGGGGDNQKVFKIIKEKGIYENQYQATARIQNLNCCRIEVVYFYSI